MAVVAAGSKPGRPEGKQPLRKRVLFHFRSSLERRGYTGRQLRNRFSYSAALRARSPRARSRERRQGELDLAWIQLWEAISNGGEIGADDEAAILACERWRRKVNGERNGLWTRLAQTVKHSHADWDRLTAGIRGGIPSSLRGSVWHACSGAAIKRQAAGITYAEYVRLGLELRNEAANVIEVDLPRTGVAEHQLGQLRNILLAFAVKNPSIGYCQSMNFIAKTLLLYNEEERTFWILCSLIEDVLPAGYYTPTMSGLRSDLKLLDSLIGHYLPNLKNHLLKHGIDLAPITMNWFLCLFVNTLPAEQSHRVLDCLLHEGPKVLFRAALAILHMREAELLKTQAVVDAYPILRAPYSSDALALDEEPRKPASGGQTIDLLNSMYGLWLQGLSTDTVSHLREEHLKAVGLEDEAHEARREAWRQRQQQPQPPPPPPPPPQEAREEPGGGGEDATPPAPEREPERLRAESFALISRLPVQPSRLGFAERVPDDSPNAAASWLARVTGDEVDESPGASGEPTPPSASPALARDGGGRGGGEGASGAKERCRGALVSLLQAEESPSGQRAEWVAMEGNWDGDDRFSALNANTRGFAGWFCCQRQASPALYSQSLMLEGYRTHL